MRAFLVSFVSLFFLVQAASAATLSFSGTVSSSDSSEFSAGDVMTGFFEVDTTNLLFESSDTKRFPILTATVSIGSSFSASLIGSASTFVDAYNTSSFDGYTAAIYVPFNNGVVGTSLVPTTFSLLLQNTDTTTLDSTDFPEAIDLSDFPITRWSISFDDNGQRLNVLGQLTEIEVSTPAVPLPAGLPLLVAGLCAFGLVRRRM